MSIPWPTRNPPVQSSPSRPSASSRSSITLTSQPTLRSSSATELPTRPQPITRTFKVRSSVAQRPSGWCRVPQQTPGFHRPRRSVPAWSKLSEPRQSDSPPFGTGSQRSRRRSLLCVVSIGLLRRRVSPERLADRVAELDGFSGDRRRFLYREDRAHLEPQPRRRVLVRARVAALSASRWRTPNLRRIRKSP